MRRKVGGEEDLLGYTVQIVQLGTDDKVNVD